METVMCIARRQGRRAAALVLLAAIVLGIQLHRAPGGDPPQTPPVFEERFSAGRLDEKVWRITRTNDFQKSTIDVLAGRLRLHAATIGTKPDTVKFHGVRTLLPVVDFSTPVAVGVELDWNKQANGCYMTAGVYLCATGADTGPTAEPDWVAVEYAGVPPGRNARCLVSARVAGQTRQLFTEGWPENRRGRPIGVQRIRLEHGHVGLRVVENDKVLYGLPRHGLAFTKAYIYIQMSSHSNYPPREVFFDNVEVRPAAALYAAAAEAAKAVAGK
jgi:hypothetical protein